MRNLFKKKKDEADKKQGGIETWEMNSGSDEMLPTEAQLPQAANGMEDHSMDETQKTEPGNPNDMLMAGGNGTAPMVADDAETQPLDAPNQPEAQYARGDRPRFSLSRAQTVGTRSNQEDSLCNSDWGDQLALNTRGLLAAVADGIGGMDNGEVASSLTVQTMYKMFMQQDFQEPARDRLLEMAAKAHSVVSSYGKQNNRAGTTMVAILIQDWDLWQISAGDSRIYLYRGGGLIQLNRPHVYGKECEESVAMNAVGEVPEGRRAQALTSYIGQENIRHIDRNIQPIHLLPDDKILLMSDGVFNTLSEEELTELAKGPADNLAPQIITEVEARQKRSQDNATVIAIELQK